MNTFTRTLVLLAALGALTRAVACDSCALTIVGRAERPGFTLSTAHQFTRLGSVWQHDRRLGNPADQYLDSHITQVSVGFTDGGPWHAQLTLPYISRSYLRPDHARIERGHESGLGDTTLAARYEIWQTTTARGDTFELHVLGGVEFGTGDSDRLEPADHVHHHHVPSGIHDHDLTLGSGSTDWLIGADAGWRRGRLSARLQVQRKLRRPGAFDYRLADETNWEFGAGGQVLVTGEHSLAVQAIFVTDRKGLDSLAGTAQTDTGASIRYLGARFTGTLGRRFEADFAFEVPVRIRTSGIMVAPDYRVRSAMNWRF